MHCWSRSNREASTRIPYACNSWRCKVCRRYEAAVTFARIREASQGLDPRGWVFLVLTLDRNAYFGGKKWLDVNEAYRSLGKMSGALLPMIGRKWGPDSKTTGKKRLRVVRKLGNRWISVVEAHRSGWPHMNVALWCPALADELRRERAERLEDPELANDVELVRDAWLRKEPCDPRVRENARRATLVGGELRQMLEASGWGIQSTAEAANDAAAVASYMVGLMKLHESSTGELAENHASAHERAGSISAAPLGERLSPAAPKQPQRDGLSDSTAPLGAGRLGNSADQPAERRGGDRADRARAPGRAATHRRGRTHSVADPRQASRNAAAASSAERSARAAHRNEPAHARNATTRRRSKRRRCTKRVACPSLCCGRFDVPPHARSVGGAEAEAEGMCLTCVLNARDFSCGFERATVRLHLRFARPYAFDPWQERRRRGPSQVVRS